MRGHADGDAGLVEACLRGEEAAWEQLVRRHASLVYAVPYKYGLDGDEAADVFQNTWAALWRELDTVRNRDRLSPWLITVSSRLSYQQLERRRREQATDVDLLLQDEPDSNTPPDEQAIARLEAAALNRAMSRLPDHCRQLLEMLFYEPRAPTYVEMARRLAVSPDTIGSWRGRCLRQLKSLMEQPEAPS